MIFGRVEGAFVFPSLLLRLGVAGEDVGPLEVHLLGQSHVCQLPVVLLGHVADDPIAFCVTDGDSRPDIDDGKFIDFGEVVLDVEFGLKNGESVRFSRS